MLFATDKRIKILDSQLNKQKEKLLGWYQEDIYFDSELLITLEFETKFETLQSSVIKSELVAVHLDTDTRKVFEVALFRDQQPKHYSEQLNLEVMKIKKFFKNLIDNKK